MSKILARKLADARAKLGISQSQAALEWGIPLKSLQNWEQDQRTPRGLALTAINNLLDGILQPSPAKNAARKKR